MPILNRIAAFAPDMAQWRQHLHRHPELGLDCHETAAFVVARLREFGVQEIHTGIATSGVVAVIRGQGDGPVTGLRADMDALPMQEATGAAHASTIDGRMHACGHDGHTTMLLGAARYLSENNSFRGAVVLIFQPAEETIGGGRIMVEDEGIMDRFGIEEVYALHTDPFGPLGQFRTAPGPLLAAVDDFDITLTGVGGHAAYAQTCVDPIPAALALGQGLLSVPARNIDGRAPFVLSVTQVQSGSAHNIVPDTAHLAGTVRCFDEQIRATARARIHALADGVAAAYGVQAHVAYHPGYPPTINSAAQAGFAADVAAEVSGDVEPSLAPEMGAEDFSYMLQARPGAFVFLGQGLGPSVHHPEFDFNDEAAAYGASFFARLIERRHGRAA